MRRLPLLTRASIGRVIDGLRRVLPSVQLRFALATLAGAALLLPLGATPASAVDAVRLQAPVMAGSQIRNSDGSFCTAGPVLDYHSVASYVLPAQRATRYVLTAKHCNPLHAAVLLGSGVAGRVDWVSDQHDVELITVAPLAQRRQICSYTSYGPYCHVIVAYEPRAVGSVLAPAPYSRDYRPMVTPVRGVGSPTPREQFCTSGRTTGIICGFVPGQLPRTWFVSDPILHTGDIAGPNIFDGDSGGPVMSVDGKIYGTIVGYGRYAGVDKMTYLPFAVIQQQLPSYGLAPA
ncbi:trypsin-like serine protease [Clavibacter sepedonicus]|nr:MULTISPECIES: trypsin-like serine protease [Clavibacter]MBD5380848.1 hypothetical protein [Clavibacter sp.]